MREIGGDVGNGKASELLALLGCSRFWFTPRGGMGLADGWGRGREDGSAQRGDGWSYGGQLAPSWQPVRGRVARDFSVAFLRRRGWEGNRAHVRETGPPASGGRGRGRD